MFTSTLKLRSKSSVLLFWVPCIVRIPFVNRKLTKLRFQTYTNSTKSKETRVSLSRRETPRIRSLWENSGITYFGALLRQIEILSECRNSQCRALTPSVFTSTLEPRSSRRSCVTRSWYILGTRREPVSRVTSYVSRSCFTESPGTSWRLRCLPRRCTPASIAR